MIWVWIGIEMGVRISRKSGRAGLLLIAFATVALAGCGNLGPYAIADGATVVVTDKTMIDHAISVASGKDCSVVRVEQGLRYCKEDEVVPHPVVFCYRELGDVTCYSNPDPRQEKGPLGYNDHNRVKQH